MGVVLKVRMKNPLYDKRHLYVPTMKIPEFIDYIGEVVQRPSWVSKKEFCLSTGTRPFKMRVLPKDNIVCGWRIK